MEVIGRIQKIHLPEFNLEKIVAKVDTGAYTSSMHCSRLKMFEKENELYVEFSCDDYHNGPEELFVKKVIKYKQVKSSNGITESRYMIKTKVRIKNIIYPIYFTLTDRADMRHTILIGRKFLYKKFLVDVSLPVIKRTPPIQ